MKAQKSMSLEGNHFWAFMFDRVLYLPLSNGTDLEGPKLLFCLVESPTKYNGVLKDYGVYASARGNKGHYVSTARRCNFAEGIRHLHDEVCFTLTNATLKPQIHV